MEDQLISIKSEFKPHEILAICCHFYNKGYYISSIDEYYNSGDFKFRDINTIEDKGNTSFTSQFTKDSMYEFKFINNKDRWGKPQTNIYLNYNGATLDFKYHYSGYSYDHNIKRCETGKISYNMEDIKEKQNFYQFQNKTVEKMKFYEENIKYFEDNIYLIARRQKYFTFNYIYSFKSYISNIASYIQGVLFDKQTFCELIDCVTDDMQTGIFYNFKILNFYKTNHNNFKITLNKTHDIYLNRLDSMKEEAEKGFESGYIGKEFNVILPIFKQLGGADALRSVILTSRIMTE